MIKSNRFKNPINHKEEKSIFDEFAASDSDFGSILKEWKVFREGIQIWFGYGEAGFLAYTSSGRVGG